MQQIFEWGVLLGREDSRLPLQALTQDRVRSDLEFMDFKQLDLYFYRTRDPNALELILKSVVNAYRPQKKIYTSEQVDDLSFNPSLLNADQLSRYFLATKDNTAFDLLLEGFLQEPSAYFPSFLMVFETLVQEPQSILKTKEKNTKFMQTLINIIKNHARDFPAALTALRNSLLDVKWRSLKQLIDKEFRARCPTVEACLIYKQHNIANQLVMRSIANYIPGKENRNLVKDLSWLLFFDSGLLIARDRFLELYKKDPQMLETCDTIFEIITKRIYKEKPQDSREWCRFILSLDSLPAKTLPAVAKHVAQEQISAPIPVSNHQIFLHWISKGDPDQVRAFWLSIKHLDFTQESAYKLAYRMILHLNSPPQEESGKDNRKRLHSSLGNFLIKWCHSPRDENLAPLGSLFGPLVQSYIAEASMQEKLDFLIALSNGHHRGVLNFAQSFFFILWGLEESEENTLFTQPLKMQFLQYASRTLLIWNAKYRQPKIRKEISRLTGKLWDVCLKNTEYKFKMLSSREALEPFIRVLDNERDLDSLEKLEGVKTFIQNSSNIIAYRNVIYKYRQSHLDHSEAFAESCIRHLAIKIGTSTKGYSVAVACAIGRNTLIEQLLKKWTQPLILLQFKEVERALSLKTPKDEELRTDPEMMHEKTYTKKLISKAAAQGTDETWRYFLSRLQEMGFNDLLEKLQTGITKEELRNTLSNNL